MKTTTYFSKIYFVKFVINLSFADIKNNKIIITYILLYKYNESFF